MRLSRYSSVTVFFRGLNDRGLKERKYVHRVSIHWVILGMKILLPLTTFSFSFDSFPANSLHIFGTVEDLAIFLSLDFIIVTEHQLSAQFRPDKIIRSGWDFHAVSGAVTNLPQKGYRGQRHRGGLALLTRDSKHFSVKMKSLSGVVNKITGDNCSVWTRDEAVTDMIAGPCRFYIRRSPGHSPPPSIMILST